MNTDETALEEIRELLKEAVEFDGGTCYENEDDEIGTRCCCYVRSYYPHTADCWVTRAAAILARKK